VQSIFRIVLLAGRTPLAARPRFSPLLQPRAQLTGSFMIYELQIALNGHIAIVHEWRNVLCARTYAKMVNISSGTVFRLYQLCPNCPLLVLGYIMGVHLVLAVCARSFQSVKLSTWHLYLLFLFRFLLRWPLRSVLCQRLRAGQSLLESPRPQSSIHWQKPLG
jgi:hypothetical protein